MSQTSTNIQTPEAVLRDAARVLNNILGAMPRIAEFEGDGGWAADVQTMLAGPLGRCVAVTSQPDVVHALWLLLHEHAESYDRQSVPPTPGSNQLLLVAQRLIEANEDALNP